MKIKDANGNLIDSCEEDLNVDVECEDTETAMLNNPGGKVREDVPTLEQLKQVPTVESHIQPLAGIQAEDRPIISKVEPVKVESVNKKDTPKVVVAKPKGTLAEISESIEPGKQTDEYLSLKSRLTKLEVEVKRLKKVVDDYIGMIN